MKIEFNVIDVDECEITLDGKTAKVIVRGSGGGECDLQHLPEDTVGRIILEECWTLGLRLALASAIAEGDVWRKQSEADLNECYDEMLS